MNLIILNDNVDMHLLKMELAGRPFIEHLPFYMQSLQTVHDKTLIGDNALIIDANVWFSLAALKKLLSCISIKQRIMKIVSLDGDVFGFYLPAEIAKEQQEIGRLRHSILDCDEINASELDQNLPSTRVHNLLELAVLEQRILYERACDALLKGIRIRDPRQVAIRGELQCGKRVEIDNQVIIEGMVSLGDGVKIGAHSILKNATIGAGTCVNPFSIIEDAIIGSNTFVGPYGRIRPGSNIGDFVQIGNFVEIKKSDIGPRSRINHHAFIGNATLEKDVTIGAGTITCNHNGIGINHTEIKAGAYIGSGSQLVAPVRIGENATIGAGSTITQDAPAEKLTLARSRQMTIPNWTHPNKKRIEQ